MITCLTLQLDLPFNLRSTNISSAMHGVLMELLPNDIQQQLHTKDGYTPIKQRLLFDSSDVYWEIVCLDKDISESLINALRELDSVFIEYHRVKIPIVKTTIEKINPKEFMNIYLNSDSAKRYVSIKLLTPTSFKSNGQYDIFPEVTKIFRSIMFMFDKFNSEQNMFDHETLLFIKNNVQIIDYKLRSTRFHLEGVRIPSFIGEITFRVNGPAQLVRFVNLLLAYGSYSGIGIKTTLGMGKFVLK